MMYKGVIALPSVASSPMPRPPPQSARQVGVEVNDDTEERSHCLLIFREQEEFSGAEMKP